MSEEWRPVADFPGYEVSDYGRVRCWNKSGAGVGRRRAEPVYLKPNPDKDGYPQIHLYLLGARTVRKLYRMVLEAFVGPRPCGFECCHGNGDIGDNRLENLRWDSRQANLADQKKHGRRKTKINYAMADEIRFRVAAGATRRGTAAEFGVSKSLVNQIVSGRIWRHDQAL